MPTENEPATFSPEPPPVTLTVTHLCGALAGKQQVIARLPAVIGRSRQCDIQLDPQDMQASGRHARFWFDGQTLWVEDLGSTNGTWLNNCRITQAQLSDGDDIEFGPGGPRLRVTMAWSATAWAGNIQGETYHLGICEFPLRSTLRFPIYGVGLLGLVVPFWLGSLVSVVLLMPLGVLALLLGWSLARVNITITPHQIEYQGIWRQVSLPWREVTDLQVEWRGPNGRRLTYTIVGRERLRFNPTDYVSGIELAQLIVRRTGKRWVSVSSGKT
ncbi:MAG: FHA domain-containing protein [Chloracidobacterium sp.]